jgi:hypothetical protein
MDIGLRETNVLSFLLVIEAYLLVKVAEGSEWGHQKTLSAELVNDTA